MSTPTSKLLVGTPVVSKSRRIVLSSPSQDIPDSDSERSWAEFKGITDMGALDGASLASMDSPVQELQSGIVGESSGA